MSGSRLLGGVVASFGLGSAALAQPCEPRWTSMADAGLDGGVEALGVFGDAVGNSLYVGGKFVNAGGQSASLVARYSLGAWSPLGSGIPTFFNSHGFNGCCATVLSFAGATLGGQTRLYIGGDFIHAGGELVESVATFGVAGWGDVAGGLGFGPLCGDCAPRINDMAVLNGALYVVGGFETAGGVPANYIAAWDGTAWTAVGSGLSRDPLETDPVFATSLVVHDDGSGPALYVGGYFSRAGGVDAANIARWNGTSWSALGSGFTQEVGGPSPNVNALAVFDNGTGPKLYAGGYFQVAGGLAASNIAVWNGASWTKVGAGIGDTPNDQVLKLAVFDDGGGPALYAGGTFAVAGGEPANNIARWDGFDWSAVGDPATGGGVDGEVRALAAFEDAGRPALYVGGWFNSAGGQFSPFIARWSGCVNCYSNCDNSTSAPLLNVADFTCFLQRFAASDEYANCDGSTQEPSLNVADFTCFLQRFAAGCP